MKLKISVLGLLLAMALNIGVINAGDGLNPEIKKLITKIIKKIGMDTTSEIVENPIKIEDLKTPIQMVVEELKDVSNYAFTPKDFFNYVAKELTTDSVEKTDKKKKKDDKDDKKEGLSNMSFGLSILAAMLLSAGGTYYFCKYKK